VETPPVAGVAVREAQDRPGSALLWFALGAVVAGAAFLTAMYWG
jgi:hypothetical protein